MRDWGSLYQERGVVQKEPSAKVAEAVDFFLLSKLKTVLDLGCGTGRHTDLLYSSGFTAYGCDSSADALRIARATLPQVQFQQCDIGLLPYRDECFDGIICHAVIQHGTIAAIGKTVGEIHRVLKRGALICCSAFCRNSISHHAPSQFQNPHLALVFWRYNLSQDCSSTAKWMG